MPIHYQVSGRCVDIRRPPNKEAILVLQYDPEGDRLLNIPNGRMYLRLQDPSLQTFLKRISVCTNAAEMNEVIIESVKTESK